MNMLQITLWVGTITCLTLTGCDTGEPSETGDATQKQETTASDVVRESSEAAQTAGDFAQATIDEYTQNAREQLETVETSIQALAQRVEGT